MRSLKFFLLSVALLISSLGLPNVASANTFDLEADDVEANDVEATDDYEVPSIITNTYLDENGSLVTEYDYFDNVTYDLNGDVISVSNGLNTGIKPGIQDWTNNGLIKETLDDNNGNSEPLQACTPLITSRVISEEKVATNKKLGWHPDFPKEGNKNVKSFWFSNATKNVSFNLGVNYGAASIGVSISKGNGSGHSISNPTPKKWMRPAVIANVHKRVTEFNRRATCGVPGRIWKVTVYVPKKVWYRADKVSD